MTEEKFDGRIRELERSVPVIEARLKGAEDRDAALATQVTELRVVHGALQTHVNMMHSDLRALNSSLQDLNKTQQSILEVVNTWRGYKGALVIGLGVLVTVTAAAVTAIKWVIEQVSG